MDDQREQHLPDTEPKSGEAKRTGRALELGRFAHEQGLSSEDPRSLLDIVVESRRNSAAAYVDVLNKAHEAGLISDDVSSHTVDSLRFLLEGTGSESSEPFYKIAEAWAEDVGGEEVLARWEDLEVIFGIDRTTSKDTLTSDEKKPIEERVVRYPDRIKAGAIIFESQGSGPWGAGATWPRPSPNA